MYLVVEVSDGEEVVGKETNFMCHSRLKINPSLFQLSAMLFWPNTTAVSIWSNYLKTDLDLDILEN